MTLSCPLGEFDEQLLASDTAHNRALLEITMEAVQYFSELHGTVPTLSTVDILTRIEAWRTKQSTLRTQVSSIGERQAHFAQLRYNW